MDALSSCGSKLIWLFVQHYTRLGPEGITQPIRQQPEATPVPAPPLHPESGLLIATEGDYALMLIQAQDAPGLRQILIGRSQSCDMVIDDATVSRQHAFIIRQNGEYLLRDNDSSVGTWINGARVPAFVERFLESRDRVRLGWVELVFLGPSDLERFMQNQRKQLWQPV